MEKINIIETTEKIGNRDYIVTKVPVLTDEERDKIKSEIESEQKVLLAEREVIDEKLNALNQKLRDLQ